MTDSTTPTKEILRAARKSQHLDRPVLRAKFVQEARLGDDGVFDLEGRQRALQQKQTMMRADSDAQPSPGSTRRAGMPTGMSVEAKHTKIARETTAGTNPDNSGWTSLGPHTVGGRTLAILPINQNGQLVLYAGAASGGVWRSDDEGANWTPTEDLMPNLAIASLAADPKDASGETLFAGTGEGCLSWKVGADPDGAGIYKSTDGWSWTLIEETRVGKQRPANANSPDDGTKFGKKFGFVNGLAFAKGGKTLVAATNDGIFYSTDSKHETWKQANIGRANFTTSIASLAVNPTADATLVAGSMTGAEIYFSSDGGKKWSALKRPATSVANGRVQVCFARTKLAVGDADVPVYTSVEIKNDNASVGVTKGDGEIWSWVKGAQEFTLLSRIGGLFNIGAGNQGWYDNYIWAGDPSDAELIVAAGIFISRSTDGGGIFKQIGGKWPPVKTQLHADQHFIVEHPNYGQQEKLTLAEKDANGNPVLDANGVPANFTVDITNKRVYVGNDGGMYTTHDISTVDFTMSEPKTDADYQSLGGKAWWREINHSYGVTQFYYGAGNPHSRVVIAGAQDNGTVGHTPGNYYWDDAKVSSGDGGAVAADPSESSRWYAEYVFLQIARVKRTASPAGTEWKGVDIYGERWEWNPATGWQSHWRDKPFFIPDAKSQNCLFISPFKLDPKNSEVLLAGGGSLWRTTNASAPVSDKPPYNGVAWHALLKQPAASGKISTIAIGQTTNPETGPDYRKGDSNLVLAGYDGGKIYRTKRGHATPAVAIQKPADLKWKEIGRGAAGKKPNARRRCLCIAIDPKASGIYYAGFAGYQTGNLWKTTDGGDTWEDITGHLPDAPVHSVTFHPSNSNWVYAGTDIGLFASENGGQTWSVSNQGPASVAVFDLFWMGTTLVAVTYGRGVFQIDIPLNDKAKTVIVGDDEGNLYAVDGSNGVAVTTRKLSDDSLGRILVIQDTKSLSDSLGNALMDAVKDTAYVGDKSGNLHSINISTLQSRRTKQAGGAISARPELWLHPEDHQLYLLVASSDGHLSAFDFTDTKEPVWSMDILGLAAGETAEIYSNEVMDNWAYLTTERGVFAVRLVGDTRSVEWHNDIASAHPPLLASNRMFVSATDGTVSAFHARSGERAWSEMAGTTPCQPVWSLGAVVAGTMDGDVIGYDYKAGTELFKQSAGGPVQGITADQNMLYFTSFTGGGELVNWALVPGSPWTVNEVAKGAVQIGSAQAPLVVGDKVYVTSVAAQLSCLEAKPSADSQTLNDVWLTPHQLTRPPATAIAAVYEPKVGQMPVVPRADTPTASPPASAELEKLHPTVSLEDKLAEARSVRSAGAPAPAPSGEAAKGVSITMCLDVSGSMHGAPLGILKSAASSFVYIMRAGKDSLGITSYESKAKYVWGSRNKVQSLKDVAVQKKAVAAIGNLKTGGRTNMHEGLVYAKDMLSGDSGVRDIVFMSDGKNNVGNPIAEAKELIRAGINIYTIAMGQSADHSMLRKIAGSDEHFHASADWNNLDRLFKDILNEVGVVYTIINQVHQIKAYKTFQQVASVPKGSKVILLAVMWPNTALKWVNKRLPTADGEICLYLSELVSGKQIPQKDLSVAVSGNGFVVFKFDDPKASLYKTVALTHGTTGGTLEETTVSLGVLADPMPAKLSVVTNGSIIRAGRPLQVAVAMERDGHPIPLSNVQVQMRHPTVSPESALAALRPELDAIKECAAGAGTEMSDNMAMMALESEAKGGGPHRYQTQAIATEPQDHLHVAAMQTDQAGIHEVEINASAVDPETGQEFTLTRLRTSYVY